MVESFYLSDDLTETYAGWAVKKWSSSSGMMMKALLSAHV